METYLINQNPIIKPDTTEEDIVIDITDEPELEQCIKLFNILYDSDS